MRPADSTSKWIDTLQARQWPFEYRSLNAAGESVAPTTACSTPCHKAEGIEHHVRWPAAQVLTEMLRFFKAHKTEQ